MAIPKFEQFLYPFLYQLRDKDVNKNEIKDALIKHFNLSKEDCMQKTKSGSNLVIDSNLGWTRQWLRRALFIEIPKRGVYRITQRGRDYLESHTDLTEKDLLKYPEYSDYYYRGTREERRKKKEKKQLTTQTKEKSSKTVEGVVYILTNPAFKTFYIKIGFTTNLKSRLKDLYNTSVPLKFKVYALLKTEKYKQAEKMIHSAFKASRIGDDREFFMLKPDEALEQMKIVAEGLEGKVFVYDDEGNVKKTFDYSK